LATWLTSDPHGQRLPGYLSRLAEHLAAENRELIVDLDQLAKNVGHIKEIVSVQQSYACISGVIETLSVEQLVEDAVRMKSAKFSGQGIDVARHYTPVPLVLVDKHKVLQILVNLVSNARHALEAVSRLDKRIIIRIARAGQEFVNVSITDNGVGIAPENLTRIFQHGFTTKKRGHGFGLHSAALAAKEIGGSLSACSAGPGAGATFTLSLPIAASPAST
jgi:C4-dicarboxylate-specific signal transduction histidine kinase